MFYGVLSIGGVGCVFFFLGGCCSVFTLGCLLYSLLLCSIITFKLNVSGKGNLLRIWTYLCGGPVSLIRGHFFGIKGPKQLQCFSKRKCCLLPLWKNK